MNKQQYDEKIKKLLLDKAEELKKAKAERDATLAISINKKYDDIFTKLLSEEVKDRNEC